MQKGQTKHIDKEQGKTNMKEGLDGGVWNSLISKNLAHDSVSLRCLLFL